MGMRLLLQFSVLLLSMAILPLRAATLRGLILANEIGGSPFPNVEVSAVAGANVSATDNQGRFSLEFATRQPGDIVQIVIRKSGYVVVNDIQLRLVLPRDPDAEPVTLLVCKDAIREEMARRFYRLKSLEAVEVWYQARLQELKARGETTAAELARLTGERDQAKAVAETAAEELARVKLTDTSELYRQAMQLFLQGKVDEALQILDDEKLKGAAEAARRQAGQVVQNYLLKARILTTQFRFDEAEAMYQKAMTTVPESFQASFGFATFCYDSRRYGKALSAYERALTQARLSGDPADVARTLNGLGALHSEQRRMDDARSALKEALKIWRHLAQANPDTYLPDTAKTLNNLGILRQEQKRMEDARVSFEGALRIWHKLALANPDTYRVGMVHTLNNLGNLHRAQNRMDDARAAYEEALNICGKLVEAGPGTYPSDMVLTLSTLRDIEGMALTLNNLGALHGEQNRIEDARKAYEEALKIWRKLALANPDTCPPSMALTLHNLGLLDRVQNRMDDARTAFEEVLKIRRQLAEASPDTYLLEVALALINLGTLHGEQKRMVDARTAFEEALGIYRKLARANPDTYLPEVALALYNLGTLHHAQNRIDDAGKAYEEAMKIYERLARTNPNTYWPNMARILNNQGSARSEQNRIDDALTAFEDALKIWRQVVQTNLDAHLPEMAMTLSNLGVLYSNRGRVGDGRAALEEALKIYQAFVKQNPGRYQSDVERVESYLNQVRRAEGSEK